MPKEVDRLVKERAKETNGQLLMNAVINALLFSLIYILFQNYAVPIESRGNPIAAEEIVVRALVFTAVFYLFNWLQRKFFQNKLRKDKDS